jgi:hypothetical protein
MRDGLFFAQALDLATLQLTGRPCSCQWRGFHAAAFSYTAIDAAPTASSPLARPSGRRK